MCAQIGIIELFDWEVIVNSHQRHTPIVINSTLTNLSILIKYIATSYSERTAKPNTILDATLTWGRVSIIPVNWFRKDEQILNPLKLWGIFSGG